jgi:hypothetical protein
MDHSFPATLLEPPSWTQYDRIIDRGLAPRGHPQTACSRISLRVGERGRVMFPAHLRREIIILLLLKAAALTLLYFLFFSPAHRPAPVPAITHILGSS